MPRPLSLDTAIERFLDHLETERRLSKNTLAAYGADLAAFAAELAGKGKRRKRAVAAKDVTEAHVLAYLERQVAAGRSRATQVSPPARRGTTFSGFTGVQEPIPENWPDRPFWLKVA